MDDQSNTRQDSFAPPNRWVVDFGGTAAEAELSMETGADEMKRVYSLLDRLKARSEVRQIAEGLLTRNATRLDSLTPVIRPLIRPNRTRWRERQVATWILGMARLDPHQRQFAVESLVKLMERKLDPDKSEIAIKALWRSAVASLFLALPFQDANFMEGPPFPVIAMSLFCCVFPVWMIAAAYNNLSATARIVSEAARSLGNLRATEALDVLVAAANNDRRVRQAAMESLPAVLPTLNSTYHGHVRSDTMQGLCRLLITGNETLALAIVNAFASIGDISAIGPVEKLAAGEGRAGREPRVHHAAQAALPQIQARISRARDPHQLLRGAAMPATPVEQLLRPTREAVPTDPLELLRASADPNWKGTEQEITFVVRILADLKEHGDLKSLGYVEQIAANHDADSRIRMAAYECLPALRAHHELERYSPRQAEGAPNILGIQSNL